MDQDIQAQAADPALDAPEAEADLGNVAKGNGDADFVESGADI